MGNVRRLDGAVVNAVAIAAWRCISLKMQAASWALFSLLITTCSFSSSRKHVELDTPRDLLLIAAATLAGPWHGAVADAFTVQQGLPERRIIGSKSKKR